MATALAPLSSGAMKASPFRQFCYSFPHFVLVPLLKAHNSEGTTGKEQKLLKVLFLGRFQRFAHQSCSLNPSAPHTLLRSSSLVILKHTRSVQREKEHLLPNPETIFANFDRIYCTDIFILAVTSHHQISKRLVKQIAFSPESV